LLTALLKVPSFHNPFLNLSTDTWEEIADYSGVGQYNQSKLANVYFTKELARREAANGVSAYALHPGNIFFPHQYYQQSFTAAGVYLHDMVWCDTGVIRTNLARSTGCLGACCMGMVSCCLKSIPSGSIFDIYSYHMLMCDCQ
jgi:hypothetical protein